MNQSKSFQECTNFVMVILINLWSYHDLYVQTDTLLFADVLEKFRDTCIEIYGLDPSHFLSAPGLAWQACLKKQMWI